MSKYTVMSAREYKKIVQNRTVIKFPKWTSVQLPNVHRVFASTISNHLVSLQPMSSPQHINVSITISPTSGSQFTI